MHQWKGVLALETSPLEILSLRPLGPLTKATVRLTMGLKPTSFSSRWVVSGEGRFFFCGAQTKALVVIANPQTHVFWC
jgi:hypothetical protein